MSRTFILALVITIIAASLADACGWFGDLFVGALLSQFAILAAGALAEAVVPGSGPLIMSALEGWLGSR